MISFVRRAPKLRSGLVDDSRARGQETGQKSVPFRGATYLTLATLLASAGGLAYASTFGLNEPFDTPGALSGDWVVSGVSVTPQVVTVGGDTPTNALRLTSASPTSQAGFALYDVAISTTQGIDISFNQAQWGGNYENIGLGADGLVFFVKDAANSSNIPGASGGGLGYARNTATGGSTSEGLPGALLGIGFDAQGAFDNTTSDGTDCGNTFARDSTNGGANNVVIRGPGQGTSGYCMLADTYRLSANSKDLLLVSNPGSRSAAKRTVRVVIDSALKADPKVTVFYQGDQIIQVDLPSEFNSVSAIKVGFAAATGDVTNNNEVWGVTSAVANPEIPADSGGQGSVEEASSEPDDEVSGPAIALTPFFAVGEKACGKEVGISGYGLESGSNVSLTMHSPQQVLFSRALSSSRIEQNVGLPASLVAGTYQLAMSATSEMNQPLDLVRTFSVDSDCVVTALDQGAAGKIGTPGLARTGGAVPPSLVALAVGLLAVGALGLAWGRKTLHF